jgi:hypothetical protein
MRKSLLRPRVQNKIETSNSALELMQELASHLKDPSVHDTLSLCKWWDKEVHLPENSQSKIQLLALGYTLVTSWVYELPARVTTSGQPLQFTIYRYDLGGRRWYCL